MLGVFERFLLVFAAALITYAVAYFYYKRTSAAFWGYIAVWLLEASPFIAFITGAQNLQFFDFFNHAFGIPVIAALLVIADILMIQIALVGALKPLSFVLPKQLNVLFRVEGAIKTLQKYHALPHTERVEAVFVAAVMGGLISTALLFVAGAFA